MLMGLTLAIPALVAGCRSLPATGPAASLTVVPPGPLLPQSRVEIRVALHNPSAAAVAVRVRLSVVAGAASRPVGDETVTVPAGTARLSSAWWTPGDALGALTVQARLDVTGGRARTLSWPLTVLPGTTCAPPWLQGAWLDPLGLLNSVYPRSREVTEQDVRDLVSSLARLGVRALVLTYVEYQGHFFYPSRITFQDRDMQREAAGQWLPFDVLEAVLSQADRQGMHVFLGLGRGGDTQLLWGGLRDRERLAAALDLGCRVAAELWERYGSHASFYGWYLTHEMDDLNAAAAYYDPIADACHALAPDKPVMVAPAGTPVISRELLAASHVDIFAYQDAVGAGYRPGEYTYHPETRLAVLDEVFASYRDGHAGVSKHFWADLELWQMAGPTYAAPFPAEFARVARQIASEARYASFLTGYEVSGFLQDPSAALQLKDPRAAALWRAYEAYLRGVVTGAR